MDAEQVAAVVDFGPPDPFITAWELGRIAYDPRTVIGSPDFPDDAATVIAAYRETNPTAPPDAITHSARSR